jgi:LSD1 subclass zinc finger protein
MPIGQFDDGSGKATSHVGCSSCLKPLNLPVGEPEETIVRCASCGAEIGTLKEITARASEIVKDKTIRDFLNGLKRATRGSRFFTINGRH